MSDLSSSLINFAANSSHLQISSGRIGRFKINVSMAHGKYFFLVDLPSSIFSSMLFTFSLVVYSDVIRFSPPLLYFLHVSFFSSPINTTGRVLPISTCCCLFADQNLNVFSAAERSDIAEKARNVALLPLLGWKKQKGSEDQDKIQFETVKR